MENEAVQAASKIGFSPRDMSHDFKNAVVRPGRRIFVLNRMRRDATARKYGSGAQLGE
jgi:hypothetical protein